MLKYNLLWSILKGYKVKKCSKLVVEKEKNA